MRSKKSNKENLKFWAKIHVIKEEIVVAICDKNLLGKSLSFRGVKVKISERFFKGELIGEEHVDKLLSNATIANLFGNEIVKLAAKLGYIDMKNVIKIEGIYHAQFVKL